MRRKEMNQHRFQCRCFASFGTMGEERETLGNGVGNSLIPAGTSCFFYAFYAFKGNLFDSAFAWYCLDFCLQLYFDVSFAFRYSIT